jgi:hypothetical protein
VTKNNPTQAHFNSLSNFRHQVYALFENQRDVLFEITDAVIQTADARSYAHLSLAPAFTRQWPSLYTALADGKIDSQGLRALSLQQALRQPQSRLHFAIDVMAVRRMHSPTLKDRLFCHGAQREVGGKGIIIGLPYSILAYVERRGTSWAPALATQRVKPDQSAVEVAVTQARWVAERLPARTTPEIALDGSYGNLKFFAGLRGVRAFATARMRNDRVLYQLPPTAPKGKKKKRGRRPKYGPAFRFAESKSWPTPNEVLDFEDPKFGLVRLELWSALRFRVKKEIVDISVVRSQIHLEKDKPPAPHWYGVHNGTAEQTTLARVFECVTHRWPIEPANRFRKERLYAELPKVRQAEASDLWLELVQVVEWELYLWRVAASDAHLPWQKPVAGDQLTPGRVIRSLSENLERVGTPVSAALPRGKSPGWPIGRVRAAPAIYRLESKKRKKALEMSKNE